MGPSTSVLFLLALTAVGQALTPTSYFTPADQARLRAVFESARPYGDDVESVYYSVLGFTLLGDALDTPSVTCDSLKKNVNTKDVDSLFFATAAAQLLKTKGKTTCQFATAGAPQQMLGDAVKGEATTQTIYHAVGAMSNLGVKVDSQKVIAAILESVRKDDTAQQYAFAFYAASYLSGDLKKIHDLIEDVVAQADTVDDKYLQFEGGLYTTAVVIDGSYKLAAVFKKAPTLTDDKVIKFTNYFLSRKHAQSVKNAALVLAVAKTLTDNTFHIPVAVTLASQVYVSEKNPTVQVRVCNLMGQSVGKLTTTADTARHVGDLAVIISKKAFTPSSADSTLYELNLMSVKPARGFYKLSVSTAPLRPDARFIGTSGAEVEVKVTTQVAIENVEFGVAHKDQTAASKTTKLQHPNKAATVLEVDHQEKLIVKFQLRDLSSKTPMAAHQVFVKLTNQKTGQEVIFVAEIDGSQVYKFDLDVGSSAKEFSYLSGKYSVDVIVGDAVIQNPFSWTLADVQLTFQEGPASLAQDKYQYSARPEIQHMFREPEKRPSEAVSNLFTILVLSPFALLLVLWLRVGANVSNMPMTLSAIGFHVGLAAIFALYYCYWTHLNMFQTMRYLGLLAVPTFLFGNRLLSGIASRRK